MIETLYQEVSKRLDLLPFETFWPGFHRFPFALYTKDHAVLDGVLIATPEDFYGNTTIFFENRHIAIWNLDLQKPDNWDTLAASLVHEMFHAFQMECEDTRFPDDLSILAAPVTPEALAWSIQERQLLAGTASLSEFSASRLQRRVIGSTLEEERTETAEGMAQYVELLALRTLSPTAFSAAIARCRARLTAPALALDFRRRSYDSGTFLLLRAAEAGISMHHMIGTEKRTIFELLLEKCNSLPDPEPLSSKIYATADTLLTNLRTQQRTELQAFFQLDLQRLKGCFRICGYDPMQMWRLDDTLFSRGFLALRDANGTVRSIRGKALLHMAPGDAYLAEDCLVPSGSEGL